MFPFPPPCPTSQKIWMLSQSFTSSPRSNLVGSREVTQPDGAGRPGSTCDVVSLISVLGAPWRLVRRWRLTSDSDREGSIPLTPSLLSLLPTQHLHSTPACGRRTHGGLPLTLCQPWTMLHFYNGQTWDGVLGSLWGAGPASQPSPCCFSGSCVKPAPSHHVSAGRPEFRLDQVGFAWGCQSGRLWGSLGLGGKEEGSPQ